MDIAPAIAAEIADRDAAREVRAAEREAEKAAREIERETKRAEMRKMQEVQHAQQVKAQQRAQLLHMITTIAAGVVRTYPATVPPANVIKRSVDIARGVIGAVDGLLAQPVVVNLPAGEHTAEQVAELVKAAEAEAAKP